MNIFNCDWFCVPQRLADWVAVQSVSAWPEKRGEIKNMMEMAAKDIERLGGTTELVDIGKQKVGFLSSSLNLLCIFNLGEIMVYRGDEKQP